MFRLLERLRNHDGHRLTVPVHHVVLHRRQIASRETGACVHHIDQVRRLELWRVLMRNQRDESRRPFGRRCIDPYNPAFGDGAVYEHRVRKMVKRNVSGEARLAGDLRIPVDTSSRLPQVPARLIEQRIGLLCRHHPRNRLYDRSHHTHRAPPAAVNSLSTSTIVRFANSILKSLWAKPSAVASSSSAARRNTSIVAGAPVRARSDSRARHGLCATPPSASRTSLTEPASTAMAAATLTS